MNDDAVGPAPSAEDAYVAQHVREALAQDPRVADLAIAVTVEPGKVYLSGQVTTEERRSAIGAVAGELLPGHQIRNQVTVTVCRDHGDVENLR